MKTFIAIISLSVLMLACSDDTPTERPPDVESPLRSIESYSDRVAEAVDGFS